MQPLCGLTVPDVRKPLRVAFHVNSKNSRKIFGVGCGGGARAEGASSSKSKEKSRRRRRVLTYFKGVFHVKVFVAVNVEHLVHSG